MSQCIKDSHVCYPLEHKFALKTGGTQLVVVLWTKTACAQFSEHHACVLEGIEDLQLFNAPAHRRGVRPDNGQCLLEQSSLVFWRGG